MENIALKNFGKFLAQLAEKSEHVYWLSSADFSKIEYISPAYKKIWGREIDKLYENPSVWLNFLHPDDSRHHHPIMAMKERIEKIGAQARYEENYRIIRPDGEVRWIMDRGFPVYDDHGNCLAVTGVALDVTKEKLAEIALEKAKEEAEAANRAKTEFLANMSHDAKTPLTGIVGMADIARHDFHARDIDRNRAEAIYTCGMQMVSFFDSCLALSKMEMENWITRSEVFSLKTLLNDIYKLFFPMTQIKNLTLQIIYDDQLSEIIEGHRESLYRILLNLVGNAIKFTHIGKITLRVFSISINNDELKVGLSVSDTGIGIPEDKFQIIFEKMHRLKPSYQENIEGSGMGLYIVDQYVKRMGGSINVTSRVGEGSTFTVSLTLKNIQATNNPKQIILQDQEISSTPRYSGRILLIEDVLLVQHITKSLLNNMGIDVDIASSGHEALRMFSPGKYHLIYMDIGLPDIDGYQISQRIRFKEKELYSKTTPIIALTGHGTIDVKTFCGNAGMQGVLSKPLSMIQAENIWKKYVELKNIDVPGLVVL